MRCLTFSTVVFKGSGALPKVTGFTPDPVGARGYPVGSIVPVDCGNVNVDPGTTDCKKLGLRNPGAVSVPVSNDADNDADA